MVRTPAAVLVGFGVPSGSIDCTSGDGSSGASGGLVVTDPRGEIRRDLRDVLQSRYTFVEIPLHPSQRSALVPR
jgi:hypothetical protein